IVNSTVRNGNGGGNEAEFDHFDEEQFMSIILANRQSAQQSRVRKLKYITELERNVNSLQAEVSVLSLSVAYLNHQRLILNVDNSVLKQRIVALSQDKIFNDENELESYGDDDLPEVADPVALEIRGYMKTLKATLYEHNETASGSIYWERYT
ncbi:basic leucine zipper 61-like protein, partial [Tanacetum coccineum]